MDSQRVSPPGPDPGMCGCDRDIFLRVWRRVMPEERADCPIEVVWPPQKMTVAAQRLMKPASERDSGGDDFPTQEDVSCLGSKGAADRERLQEWTRQEMICWRTYQMLAQRSGPGGRVLSKLASNCHRRAKRLSAALFLISGIRYWPGEQGARGMPRSYFGTLREHFLSEQNRGDAYRAAAEDCPDGCLRALYLDLADECAEHAGRIRGLLESM